METLFFCKKGQLEQGCHRVYTQNLWKTEEKTRNLGKKNGAPTRTRTLDPMIQSHLLYRLSYGRTLIHI